MGLDDFSCGWLGSEMRFVFITLFVGVWTIFFVSCGQEDGFTTHYADPDNQFNYGRTGKISEGNYKDGKKEGHWVFYTRDGKKINWEANFRNGKKQGVVTYWYNGKKSGRKSSETNYKDDKPSGLSKHYYKNGKLSSAAIWYTISDTTYLKDIRSLKPNGDICPLTNVKDGTGLFVMYDENGEEEERAVYKNGVLFR